MTVILIEPSAGNEYGVSLLLIRRIADLLRKRGQAVHVLNPSRDRLPVALLDLARDPDSLLYLGNYYFDMTVTAENQLLDINLIDMIDRPAIGFIGDHPMSRFMWRRIAHAAARPVYHVIDRGLSKEIGYLTDASLDTVERSAPYVYECDQRIEPKDKPVDLFIPVNLQMQAKSVDQIRDAFQAGSKWRLIVGDFHDALRDRGLTEVAVEIFGTVVSRHLDSDLKSLRSRNPQVFQILLSIFSEVDLAVRAGRRDEVCARMIGSAGGRRVLVASPRPAGGRIAALSVRENVEFLGFMTPEAVGHTMARSKLVLNVSPTYSDCIHERVLNTLASHAVPLTDETREIRRELRAETDYAPLRPEAGLQDILDLYPADRLDAIAQSGRARVVPKYAPEAYFDRMADRARRKGRAPGD